MGRLLGILGADDTSLRVGDMRLSKSLTCGGHGSTARDENGLHHRQLDAFLHISEENEGVHSGREVWTATAATFAAKFLMAVTFLIPVFLLPLSTAVAVAIAWGAVALAT